MKMEESANIGLIWVVGGNKRVIVIHLRATQKRDFRWGQVVYRRTMGMIFCKVDKIKILLKDKKEMILNTQRCKGGRPSFREIITTRRLFQGLTLACKAAKLDKRITAEEILWMMKYFSDVWEGEEEEARKINIIEFSSNISHKVRRDLLERAARILMIKIGPVRTFK